MFGSTHVIERADGTVRRLCGYRHAERPEGARDYEAGRFEEDHLPPKVDLRPYMSAVENQGQMNSCVANAVAGAYEYLAKRHLGEEAFGEYLTPELLASIANDAFQLAGADGLTDEEHGFVSSLVESWQLER